MRALSLRGPRDARVVDVADPAPAAGEVLVRIGGCGLCGSDLNAWRGIPGIEYPLPPGAPGHETWGQVVEIGPGVSGLRVGQRVTGLLGTGFAELGVARTEDLVVVPDGLADVGVLGEPLACAMNVVRRSRLTRGQPFGVVGFGYLAALLVQLVPSGVGDWVALSQRAASRALARELGAADAHDYSNVPGELWDSLPVVIEAAGVQQTLDFATWLTAYGGRLVIAGYHADGPRTVNMQSWNWKGIDVINAHERQSSAYVRGLGEALVLVQERHLDLSPLQTHLWSLDEAAEAFATAEARPAGFVKGVVVP